MALVHVHVVVKRNDNQLTPIGTYNRSDRDEYIEAFEREVESYVNAGYRLLDEHVKITGSFMSQQVIHPVTEDVVQVCRWYCVADSCVVPHEECGASKDMGPRHDLTRVQCDAIVGHKLNGAPKHTGIFIDDFRVEWS